MSGLLVITASRGKNQERPERHFAEEPSGDTNAKAADHTKRTLVIGMYALLGLAAACALSACFPSAEGKQPEEKADPNPQRGPHPHRRSDLGRFEQEHARAHAQPEGSCSSTRAPRSTSPSFPTLCVAPAGPPSCMANTHNHQILSNEPPLGGFEKFRPRPRELHRHLGQGAGLQDGLLR